MNVTDFDYPYIRAWGKRMGARPAYTERLLKLAREEDAPQNVIYIQMGVWRTFEEVTTPATRKAMVQLITSGWEI